MDSDVGILFFLLGTIGIFVFVVMFIPYLFMAFGLYRMAEREGMENSWFAFIPYVQYYIMGELISNKLGGNGGMKLLVGAAVSVILSFIPVLGVIIAIAYFVAYFVVLHWLMERYTDKAVLLTIFNIITGGFVGMLAIFFIRNNSDHIKGV